MNHPIEQVLVTKLSEQVAHKAIEELRKQYGNADTVFVSGKGCELYTIYIITDYKLSSTKARQMRAFIYGVQ